MEEDFDIYGDLDNFGKKNDRDNSQTDENTTELLKKLETLDERVKYLEKELSNGMDLKKTLETNLSSLLKTAKTELTRKDRIIAELRQQLDDIHFRRNKFQIPKIDKPDHLKKISSIEEIKKNSKVEAKQELCGNLDKSLPVYISPVPKFISPLKAGSDDEDTEETCQSKQLTTTVFGERLKKRLKDQEEKEKLQMEQTRLLNSIPNTNGIVDNKTEVKNINLNNMDNKENHYRLISLDINSPKKTLKRVNEDMLNEAPDKRKKLNEVCESSQSCKIKNIDYIDKFENSNNCTDKFINTNISKSEYFCSVQNNGNHIENLDKQIKKLSENDKKVHSSRNVDDKRDDRHSKNYKDDRSRSRSKRSESEKTYSNDNRSRRYDSKNNHYDREDTFKKRNRSKSRTDLRNQLNKRKNNNAIYNNDLNEKKYSEEKIHGEVRRSRRIEEKSYGRYVEHKKDSNYHSRDNYKTRQPFEEKNRTKRRSKSREKKSTDSMNSKKNEIILSKMDQTQINESLEEGEILDCPLDNLEKTVVDNIFEGSADILKCNSVNLHLQSPKEEKIENIEEFIHKFEVGKKSLETKNENSYENTKRSTESLEKNQENKNNDHDDYSSEKLKQEKKNEVHKKGLEKQLHNTDIQNIEKFDQKEKNVNKEIVVNKNNQLQDFKLELPSNVDTTHISNTVDVKENKTDDNKNKIIKNNKNNDKELEKKKVLLNEELKTKQKPRIIKFDDVTSNNKDPVYSRILSKYLKKKPDSHKSNVNANCSADNSDSEKTRKNDIEAEIHNGIEKNHIENINSEKVEICKFEKCENKESLKNKSECSVKANLSLEKSEMSTSSSIPSALKSNNESKISLDLMNKNEKNNNHVSSLITKNTIKRNVNKSNNEKKPSTSNESEAKKNLVSRKKKEKIDGKQNLNENNIMILSKRRRPVKLSDFSSPVTFISSIQNTNSHISKIKLKTVKE